MSAVLHDEGDFRSVVVDRVVSTHGDETGLAALAWCDDERKPSAVR